MVTDNLTEEINKQSKYINTDSYSMSIGELVNLYKDDELDIHPEFQRFFRWTLSQKSKFIESLLLSIPIPSIFVSQRENGVWDVIDGLQRLSTIFEFMGILKDENGKSLPASKLLKTEYLPSLENKYWDNPDRENSLNTSHKIFIKRQKIDVKIVKKESDKDFKYNLFQRLNTLGSTLSDQEVRNCLLIMHDKSFFEWLKNLSKFKPFLDSISLTEKLQSEQYNMELALRFFVFKNIDLNKLKKVNDLGEFLTEQMLIFVKNSNFDRTNEELIFKNTFRLIHNTLKDSTFKRYYSSSDSFYGKFLLSAYEAIAIGIGTNIDSWNPEENNLTNIRDKVKYLWSNEIFQSKTGSGINVTTRVPVIVPLGKQIFKNENTDE